MDRYAIISAVLITAILAVPACAETPPWVPPSPTPPPVIMKSGPVDAVYAPSPEEMLLLMGDVTVEGIVMAGTDDFTDCIYIQAADRSWGMSVTLPAGVEALRGRRIKVTGTVELKERSAEHIIAKKIDYIASIQSVPKPLGMANLYVGDGFRIGQTPIDLNNLGLLVKSWGRVVSVDTLNKRFVITDGSRRGSTGIEVHGGQLKSPISTWPQIGQYVAVTGISTVRPVGDGTFRCAIRLRAQGDLQVLAAN